VSDMIPGELKETVAWLQTASQALWWNVATMFVRQVREQDELSALFPRDPAVEDLLDPSQAPPDPARWAHRAFLTLERHVDPTYGSAGSRMGQLRDGKWGHKWEAENRQQTNDLYIRPVVAFLGRRGAEVRRSLQVPPGGAATHLALRDRLGAGGYADVWRAWDERLEREVAVKIVRDSAAEFSSALDHARALARVQHANVVAVFDVVTVIDPEDRDRMTAAVVTELVPGDTLAVRLRTLIPADDAHRIGSGVLDGIAAIHAAGLAHMDLHDENVLVTRDGVAKVIDILYRGTIAVLPTSRRDHHLRADIRAVGDILRALVDATTVEHPGADEFRRMTRIATDLETMRGPFSAILASRATVNDEGRAKGLLRRFQGPEGRRRLVDQLLRQPVVANDASVAEALSNAVTLRAFEPSDVLVVEGAVETDMHMLLAGEVVVQVHGRDVAKRTAGQHVGEMALIDPAKTRSATVRAVVPTVSAVVSEDRFTAIAADHAEMWRRLALELGERLRGRGALVAPRNETPQLYLAPVGPEAGAAVDALRSLLHASDLRVLPQMEASEFGRRCSTLDFVIAVTTGGHTGGPARDALVARTSLAIGALGPDRTLLVLIGCSRDGLPQSLLEVRCLDVSDGADPLVERIRPVADEIRTLIHLLGSR
jgi:CRP/FNR family cyclic AMP-dependent transcriptional regulator